jgi:hypothetical protein
MMMMTFICSSTTIAGQAGVHPGQIVSTSLQSPNLEATQRKSTQKRKLDRHKNRNHSGRYEGREIDNSGPAAKR